VELFVPRDLVATVGADLKYRYDVRETKVLPGQRSRVTALPPPRVQPTSVRGRRATQPPHSTYTDPPVVPAQVDYDLLVQRSIALDTRSIRDTPEKFGMTIKDLETLPLARQPEKVRTRMLDFQLQGLGWLLSMEHPKLPSGEEVRQFWTRRGPNWFNVASNLYVPWWRGLMG